MENIKTCGTCKQNKAIVEFGTGHWKTICKTCINAYNRAKYHERKAELLENVDDGEVQEKKCSICDITGNRNDKDLFPQLNRNCCRECYNQKSNERRNKRKEKLKELEPPKNPKSKPISPRFTDAVNQQRECTLCKTVKEPDEFCKGVGWRKCKECHNQQCKENYYKNHQKNRDRINSYKHRKGICNPRPVFPEGMKKCSSCGKEGPETDKAIFPKNNRNKCSECLKQWRHEYTKTENFKEQKKKYIEENKEKHREWQRKSDIKHKEKRSTYRRCYLKQRRANDPTFRQKDTFFSLLQYRINRRYSDAPIKNEEVFIYNIGCTIQQFYDHMESLFIEDMLWDTYGITWEIDHIKPCCMFDLSDPEEIRKCFHYTNLQPLYSQDNKNKHTTYQIKE